MSEKTERIRKRVRLAGLGAERTFKKALVRRAGLQTEQEFFGPGGVFAKAGHTEHLKGNPGIEWAKEIANSLNVHLPVPYRHACTSTLGGPVHNIGRLRFESQRDVMPIGDRDGQLHRLD